MMLGVIDTLAQDGAGNILAGETVEILVWETGARATIYADENGAATADNPLTTNSNGRVLCYVTPGTYNIRSTRSGAPDQFQTVPSLARHEFESHTEFTTWAASRTSPDGTVITVSSGGASVQFIADSAEAITGIPDGWAPFGAAISPLHFGAGLVPGTSDRTAIQAALDYVSGTYSATVNTFTNYVDLSAGVFTTDGPLYANNIRQPGFTIHFGAGGGLFSTQTSGAILEMLGTNTPEYSGIMRLETVDDPDNCPEYGLLLGRAEYGGSAAPVAPNHVVNCQIEGHYSRAAICNVGSEVSAFTGSIINKIPPSRTTHGRPAGYFGFGHMQNAVDRFGSKVSSTQSGVNTPDPSDGAFSNILHNLAGMQIKMGVHGFTTVTAITQANPAVVTASDLSEYQNDDIVLIYGGTMTEIEYIKVKVKNLSGNTFQAYDENDVAIDATGFTAFSGTASMRHQGGEPVALGACRGFRMGPTGYIQTTLNHPITVQTASGSVQSIKFDGQHETDTDHVINIETGGAGVVINDLRLDLLSASQTIHRAVIRADLTGGGTLRLNRPYINITTLAAAPSEGLVEAVGGALTDVRMLDAKISAPLVALMSQIIDGDYAEFSGRYYADDTKVRVDTDCTPTGSFSGNILQEKSATGEMVYSGRVTATYSSGTVLAATFDWEAAHEAFLTGTAASTSVIAGLGPVSLASTSEGDLAVTCTTISINSATIQVLRGTGSAAFDPADTADISVIARGRWK